MEFAVKICTFAVYLLYMLEIIEAQKPCKVPNGDAGTCIHINNCQPLMELSKKKHKTPHENMYFQQSYCGGRGAAKLKVCCPSQTMWNRFDPKPVLYPNSPVLLSPTPITNRPVVTKPGTDVINPAILQIPPSEEFVTRIYQEEGNVRNKCGIDTSSADKIFGGEDAAIDQYPWLALLQYAGDILGCGGSLISANFVLTAAHCFDGRFGAPLYVRLAEFNTTSFPTDYVEVNGGGTDSITVQIVKVKHTYPYTNFNRAEQLNDIGLIQLEKAVKLGGDFVKTICLPDRDFMPEFELNTNFTIAGWGATENATESDVKKVLSIPYVPSDVCGKEKGTAMRTQICAGGLKGQDSCSGDSGGPLMYNYDDVYYAVGVLSYGYVLCGIENKPATHTNVFKYISWIKDTMKGKSVD